ncbi:MAG: site-specific integrase [Bacteroidales bacterium]|nr:site-specific integrase [Bacteroidales bacterium]
MTINFCCRASKARKDGLSPIEMSVIIKGERSIITLDRKINPKHFIPSSQKVRGNAEVNEYLEVIKRKCYRLEVELIKLDKFDLETFIYSFKHGIPQKIDTLLNIYSKHNELYQQNVVCGKVNSTALYKYQKNMERVAEYLKTLNMTDIKLRDITPSFIEGFQNYCLKTLNNSTSNKQLKMFKRILSYAVKERLLDVSPFQLVLKEDKKKYDTLSLNEVKYLMSLKITDKRVDNIRDMFCLQALTGLSYSDMASLTKDDIHNDVIIKKRQKTDITFTIPLFPTSKKILEKYDYQLPVISNQKYNAYLKVLGDYAKLPIKLHSHLARHSYACILLNSGVDMKTISRALGHANTKITESTYAFMNDKTVVSNILEKLSI